MEVNGYKIEPYANLSGADLRCADLRGANLHYADLDCANLSGADLRSANLHGANLSGTNLYDADLHCANLHDTDLRGAKLRGANLSGTDLYGVDLSGADLRSANLRGANLCGANLSGAIGLLDSSDWLIKNFSMDKRGRLIVYKAFGNTDYNQPKYWSIKPNTVIKENIDSCRTITCGCGVNFATLDWIIKTYESKIKSGKVVIRRCYIKPFIEIVVPYNTDGKARCAELTIGKKVMCENGSKRI